MNSTLMISCGIVDLLQISRDGVMINGLSNCDHMKSGIPKAQTIIAYMRKGSLMNQRATPWLMDLGSMHEDMVSLRV